MENNEVTKRLNRISSDIKELKSNQVLGGDSWIVYRTSLDFTRQPYTQYRADFIPEIDGPFVAKAYLTSQDRTIYGSTRDLTPDPNYQGRWFLGWQSGSGSMIAGSSTIFIYSTRQGRIVLTRLGAGNVA